MPSDLDTKFPEVFYNREHQNIYHELINEEWSPFKGKTMADVFIFAMAYAYAARLKPVPLERGIKMPPTAFDSEKRGLMRSLAMYTKKDMRVIKDNLSVIKICEEYANAAIKKVHLNIKEKDPDYTSEEVLENMVTSH